MPILIVAFLLTLLLREIPLRTRAHGIPAAEEAPAVDIETDFGGPIPVEVGQPEPAVGPYRRVMDTASPASQDRIDAAGLTKPVGELRRVRCHRDPCLPRPPRVRRSLVTPQRRRAHGDQPRPDPGPTLCFIEVYRSRRSE